ncbi:MAG: transposase [Acidobacteriota bacterium]
MTDFNFKPKLSKTGFGWHSRGYLPHLDADEECQFVTFRLFDSLPQVVLEKWAAEGISDALLRKRSEVYLDAGYGECWLKLPAVAAKVRDAIFYHAGKKFDLISWVIMPNHVHLLISMRAKEHLPEVMHSIKSFSAQDANKHLKRKGQFWMHESFDRYIRDYRHYAAVVKYIENNPVKAGLCERPEDWRFGSASTRSAIADE